MLEGQFSTADLLLAQINVLPELGYGIQRSVVLETQTTDLEGKQGRVVRDGEHSTAATRPTCPVLLKISSTGAPNVQSVIFFLIKCLNAVVW